MSWPENNGDYFVIKSDDYEESCSCLTEEEQKVLDEKLKYLKNNPRHPSLNTKLLHPGAKTKKRLEKQGVSRIYEFYINRKEWRCLVYIFEEQKIVYLVGIMSHDQVKNHLKK